MEEEGADVLGNTLVCSLPDPDERLVELTVKAESRDKRLALFCQKPHLINPIYLMASFCAIKQTAQICLKTCGFKQSYRASWHSQSAVISRNPAFSVSVDTAQKGRVDK